MSHRSDLLSQIILVMFYSERWLNSGLAQAGSGVTMKRVNYLSHITTRHEPVRLKALDSALPCSPSAAKKPADRGETILFPSLLTDKVPDLF